MTTYYVYRITNNKPNSIPKYYYGFRKCNTSPSLDTKYMGSSKYLKQDIKNIGIEYFSKKIIKTFNNKESAIDYEIMLHLKFNVDKNVMFYNRCKANKFGYKCTGDVLKGKSYTDIHGEEKAIKLKEERSRKIKEISSNRNYIGDKNPNYGNKWSEAMKEKMSEMKSGQNNPIYGKIIINNGIKEKRISKDSNIPEDYVIGRIRKDVSGIVEDFLNSGLSRKEFSLLRNINYNTLKKYLKGV